MREASPRDTGPDTVPAFISMPSRTGKPARTLPFGLGPRVEPTAMPFGTEPRAPAEPSLMPPAAAPADEVAIDISEPMAPVWSGRPSATSTAPAEQEEALPPWMADRPAEPPTMRKPPMKPRRSGWAWAAAIFVGVAVGALAWRWDEVQDDRAARVATAPAVTQPPDGSAPPVADDTSRATGAGAADSAPAAVPDPTTAPPTAAGDAARPAPSPAEPAQRAAVEPSGTGGSDGANGAAGTPAVQEAPRTGGDAEVVASAQRPESTVAEVAEPGARTPSRTVPPRPAARTEPRRTSALPPQPSPRAMCGDRANFSLVYCMQQQCRKPAYSAHAQCREFRRTGEVS
jgi:hypothetical protein